MKIFIALVCFLACLASAALFGYLAWNCIVSARESTARLRNWTNRFGLWDSAIKAEKQKVRWEITTLLLCLCEISIQLWFCVRIIQNGQI